MRDPYHLAVDLLQRVIDAFDEAGVQLPDVQYVAPGSTVAFDGPQLTVHMTGLELGAPSITHNRHEQLPHADSFFARYLVTIIRDTPTGEGETPPSPDSLFDSAKENMTDIWVLTDALLEIRNGCIPGQGGLVDSAFLMDMSNAAPVGPEGGVVAVVATVEVSLV